MTTQCRTRGFTLMELLVTVAVIAILAAVIFPVFLSAKEKGRQTQCASNLRQLAQALLMYGEDHNDALPPWTNDVTESVDGSNGIPDPERLHAVLLPYVKDGHVFYCPSDPYAGRPVDWWGVYHLYSSYYYSMKCYPPITLTGWTHYRGDISLVPSDMVIIDDPNSWSKLQHTDTLPQKLTGSGCEHFDGRNMVYLDGHVKWHPNL